MNYLVNPEIVTLFGTFLAFVGTVILAFSMGRVFWELRFALDAISTTIESLVSNGNVYVFRGLEERISKAMKASKWPTLTGLFLVAIAMPIQGYSLYLSAKNTDNLISSIQQANDLAGANKQSIGAANISITTLKSEVDSTRIVALANENDVKTIRNSFNDKSEELDKKVVELKSNLAEVECQLRELHNKQMQPIAKSGD